MPWSRRSRYKPGRCAAHTALLRSVFRPADSPAAMPSRRTPRDPGRMHVPGQWSATPPKTACPDQSLPGIVPPPGQWRAAKASAIFWPGFWLTDRHTRCRLQKPDLGHARDIELTKVAAFGEQVLICLAIARSIGKGAQVDDIGGQVLSEFPGPLATRQAVALLSIFDVAGKGVNRLGSPDEDHAIWHRRSSTSVCSCTRQPSSRRHSSEAGS